MNVGWGSVLVVDGEDTTRGSGSRLLRQQGTAQHPKLARQPHNTLVVHLQRTP